MGKTKIFLSLVALICFCLTACASEKTDNNSSSPEAQLDAAEIRDDDPIGEDHDGVPEIDVDQDIDWSEDEQDGDHAENPGMHDGYYHEVGGARFYTEHDINQWLKPDEQSWGLTDFDIEQMLIDLWCQDEGRVVGNGMGYSYSNGSDVVKSIYFDMPDSGNDNMFHRVTLVYSKDGVEYTTSIQIYECPPPTAGNKGEFYQILDNYYYFVDDDLAPLILLAIEEMDTNHHGSVLDDLGLNENFFCS